MRALSAIALAAVSVAAGQPARPAAHWAENAHIAVWVDQSLAPQDAASLVERALAVWTGASDGHVTLTRASSRADASVRISFASSDHLYGETAPHRDVRTGFITDADIVMNREVPDDPLDAKIVTYMTALHELGHALGLSHSDTFSAIMYRFRRPDDGERFFGAYRRRLRSDADIGTARATGLDPEDIARLRALYE